MGYLSGAENILCGCKCYIVIEKNLNELLLSSRALTHTWIEPGKTTD
jgi:hypothetical protein